MTGLDPPAFESFDFPAGVIGEEWSRPYQLRKLPNGMVAIRLPEPTPLPVAKVAIGCVWSVSIFLGAAVAVLLLIRLAQAVIS